MATITEDYVSFETAQLLKEKGMDKSCFKHYVQKNNNDGTSEAVTTCTLQMAMKWLREVRGKYCDIGYDIDLGWFFQIIDLEEKVIVEYDYLETKYYHAENKTNFNTYEEAIEAAIKYSLKNLI